LAAFPQLARAVSSRGALKVCGDYTAHVIHTDGTPSQACEFAVSDVNLRPKN
jgi:hypothetical protein